jgi:hypothetical protein
MHLYSSMKNSQIMYNVLTLCVCSNREPIAKKYTLGFGYCQALPRHPKGTF